MAAPQFDTVTATLSFFTLPKDGSKPFYRTYEDPAHTSRSNYTNEQHEVEIENVRHRDDNYYTLDTAGFQFFKNRPAKHTAFVDEEKVKAEYYPESEALIKELTGASRVVLFDHTVRRYRPGQTDTGPDTRQPVMLVHVDQTPAAALARVHRHLPREDVPALLEKRFQIINLWRPIGNPALDRPLALCDCRTVDLKNDIVPTRLLYPDSEGETFSVKYNPDQRWKFVRAATPDECILIKCYDSVQDGSVAALTPHTAFVDLTAPKDAPKRESIELRALVFY